MVSFGLGQCSTFLNYILVEVLVPYCRLLLVGLESI